jgi:hypothetical protein
VVPDGEELDPSDNAAAVAVSINLAQPVLPVDVSITKLRVPPVAKTGRSYKIQLQVANDADAEGAASGVVDVLANGAQVASLSFADLAPRRRANLDFEWVAPEVADGSLIVEWSAVVTAPGDTDPSNDTATAQTEVTAGRGRP